MRRALLTLVVLLSGLMLNAEQPRLVVLISIDGLKPNDIETYRSSIESDGFARLLQRAALYTPNAVLNYNSTSAAAFYATLTTGATPNMHGIVDSEFYSLIDNTRISCIADAGYEGINTKSEVSPRLLQANTITDQLKSFFPESHIYAIAASAESAVMMGGHLANAAVWIDPASARFATSTYYNQGLPSWALALNDSNIISRKIGTPWQPMDNITTYHYATSVKNSWNLPRPIFLETEKAQDLMETPFVNDLLNELAIRAIRTEALGTDESPDLLMVEYTLKTKYFGSNRSAETEDAMRRLDKCIARLTDAIEQTMGTENAVIVLTATPEERTNTARDARLPHPVFHNERSMALLNAYLMALYGQGSWVTAYHNRQIYLNHSLIENQSVQLNEIEDKVAQFMLEFSAVHTATPQHTLVLPTSANGSGIIARQANSLYKHRSGDVVLTLQPGATDDESPIEEAFTPISVPLLIMTQEGEELQPGKSPVCITELCPTLCRLLKINPPNAATEMGR